MSKTKKLSLIALAAVIVTGVTGCFNHTPEEKADWVTSKISDELELNETQKLKLDAVKIEALKLKKQAHQNREDRMQKFKTFVQSEYINKSEITQLFKEKTAQIETDADPILDKIIDFHASLNTEQKQKVVEFIDEHNQDRGHGPWFGRHH